MGNEKIDKIRTVLIDSCAQDIGLCDTHSATLALLDSLEREFEGLVESLGAIREESSSRFELFDAGDDLAIREKTYDTLAAVEKLALAALSSLKGEEK